MAKLHRTLRFIFSLLLVSALLIPILGFVAADCRPQTEGSTDRTMCTSIIGGAGDNTLKVEADTVVTGAVFGDGIVGGKAGDDTIINNGITVASSNTTGTNGDIEGDVIALGNGGDDVLVNNGTVGGDMDGDTALNGDGGSDTIINNGVVDDDIDGDNVSGNGGDDLIINNGTVGGDIQGDDNNDEQGSVGGDDIIVINGVVEGKVDGDAGVQTGGDDVVILQTGANGGSDNTLYIYGQGGNDTLVFNFIAPDQATFENLSERIVNANPLRGSLEYNGQTFTWEGIEQIENALTLAGTSDSHLLVVGQMKQALLLHSQTGLLGSNDELTAVYCMNGDMTITSRNVSETSAFFHHLKADQLARLFEQAASAGAEVASINGRVLKMSADGTFYFRAAGAAFEISFPGDLCST